MSDQKTVLLSYALLSFIYVYISFKQRFEFCICFLIRDLTIFLKIHFLRFIFLYSHVMIFFTGIIILKFLYWYFVLDWNLK